MGRDSRGASVRGRALLALLPCVVVQLACIDFWDEQTFCENRPGASGCLEASTDGGDEKLPPLMTGTVTLANFYFSGPPPATFATVRQSQTGAVLHVYGRTLQNAKKVQLLSLSGQVVDINVERHHGGDGNDEQLVTMPFDLPRGSEIGPRSLRVLDTFDRPIASGSTSLGLGVEPIHVVAVGGDDGYVGNGSQPLATLGAALNFARPGDTVLVRAGVHDYPGTLGEAPNLLNSITLEGEFTDAGVATVQVSPPDAATRAFIVAGDLTVRNLRLIGYGSAVVVPPGTTPAAKVLLDEVLIESSEVSVEAFDATVLIQRSFVRGGPAAFNGYNSRLEVRDSELRDNGAGLGVALIGGSFSIVDGGVYAPIGTAVVIESATGASVLEAAHLEGGSGGVRFGGDGGTPLSLEVRGSVVWGGSYAGIEVTSAALTISNSSVTSDEVGIYGLGGAVLTILAGESPTELSHGSGNVCLFLADGAQATVHSSTTCAGVTYGSSACSGPPAANVGASCTVVQ